jgi:thiopeptide-type bacteriocin biosynthesis protein
VWAVPASQAGGEPAVPWRLLDETARELTDAGATHVWYVRKTGLRVRACGDAEVMAAILRRRSQDGVGAGAIVRATEPVYEPEEARFGGPIGLALAHDLFHADTPLALREVQLDPGCVPPRHRMALAVTLATDLATRVVRDRAEVWDVWHRLDTLARGLGGATASYGEDELAELLAEPEERLVPALGPLLAEGRALASTFAPRLRACALDGTMRVGVRTWLTAATLFAWNRRDLPLRPADLQTAIAAALRMTAP